MESVIFYDKNNKRLYIDSDNSVYCYELQKNNNTIYLEVMRPFQDEIQRHNLTIEDGIKHIINMFSMSCIKMSLSLLKYSYGKVGDFINNCMGDL